MQSGSTVGILAQFAGQDGLFLKLFQFSFLYPFIQIGLAAYAYTQYTACTSTTSTQWDGSTTSVTQVVSCSSYTAASYIPTKVNDDPYTTWLGAVAGSSAVGLIYAFTAASKFSAAFGSSSDDDEESSADAAPAPAAEPAADSTDDTTAESEDTTDADGTEDDSATTEDDATDSSDTGFESTDATSSDQAKKEGGSDDWSAGGWNSGWGDNKSL